MSFLKLLRSLINALVNAWTTLTGSLFERNTSDIYSVTPYPIDLESGGNGNEVKGHDTFRLSFGSLYTSTPRRQDVRNTTANSDNSEAAISGSIKGFDADNVFRQIVEPGIAGPYISPNSCPPIEDSQPCSQPRIKGLLGPRTNGRFAPSPSLERLPVGKRIKTITDVSGNTVHLDSEIRFGATHRARSSTVLVDRFRAQNACAAVSREASLRKRASTVHAPCPTFSSRAPHGFGNELVIALPSVRSLHIVKRDACAGARDGSESQKSVPLFVDETEAQEIITVVRDAFMQVRDECYDHDGQVARDLLSRSSIWTCNTSAQRKRDSGSETTNDSKAGTQEETKIALRTPQSSSPPPPYVAQDGGNRSEPPADSAADERQPLDSKSPLQPSTSVAVSTELPYYFDHTPSVSLLSLDRIAAPLGGISVPIRIAASVRGDEGESDLTMCEDHSAVKTGDGCSENSLEHKNHKRTDERRKSGTDAVEQWSEILQLESYIS